MKIIVCFRHLKCICRKWRRGMDYSWHVQHLLREFGRGQFADSRSVAGRQADGETPQQYEPHLANRVRSGLFESQARV